MDEPMAKVVDLAMERVERESNNLKVSVEELLMLALKDVRSGYVKNPVKAFFCIVSDDGETFGLNGYRCGLTKTEEIGYIEAFKLQTWNRWVNG